MLWFCCWQWPSSRCQSQPNHLHATMPPPLHLKVQQPPRAPFATAARMRRKTTQPPLRDTRGRNGTTAESDEESLSGNRPYRNGGRCRTGRRPGRSRDRSRYGTGSRPCFFSGCEPPAFVMKSSGLRFICDAFGRDRISPLIQSLLMFPKMNRFSSLFLPSFLLRC